MESLQRALKPGVPGARWGSGQQQCYVIYTARGTRWTTRAEDRHSTRERPQLLEPECRARHHFSKGRLPTRSHRDTVFMAALASQVFISKETHCHLLGSLYPTKEE